LSTIVASAGTRESDSWNVRRIGPCEEVKRNERGRRATGKERAAREHSRIGLRETQNARAEKTYGKSYPAHQFSDSGVSVKVLLAVTVPEAVIASNVQYTVSGEGIATKVP